MWGGGGGRPLSRSSKAKKPKTSSFKEGEGTDDTGSSLAESVRIESASSSDPDSSEEEEGGNQQGPHRKHSHSAPPPPPCSLSRAPCSPPLKAQPRTSPLSNSPPMGGAGMGEGMSIGSTIIQSLNSCDHFEDPLSYALTLASEVVSDPSFDPLSWPKVTAAVVLNVHMAFWSIGIDSDVLPLLSLLVP